MPVVELRRYWVAHPGGSFPIHTSSFSAGACCGEVGGHPEAAEQGRHHPLPQGTLAGSAPALSHGDSQYSSMTDEHSKGAGPTLDLKVHINHVMAEDV